MNFMTSGREMMSMLSKAKIAVATTVVVLGFGAAPGWAEVEQQGEEKPVVVQDSEAQVTDSPAGFSVRIGDSGSDAGEQQGEDSGKGIVIHVGGDGDRGSARISGAGRVVDRVVSQLDAALENLPEEVRSEMDAEDVRELRAALQEIQALKSGGEVVRVDTSESLAEVLAPVMAILLLFGGPIMIVAIVSFNNRRKREMVHGTIDKIIEQGRDVPVELLDALDKGKNGKSTLARGTVNVALGIGIGAALYSLSGPSVATLGLIPFCIGAAQLLVWVVEGKESRDRTAG
jgi:hypothetical protein